MINLFRETFRFMLLPSFVVGIVVSACVVMDRSYAMWPILTGVVMLWQIASFRFVWPIPTDVLEPDHSVQASQMVPDRYAQVIQDLYGPYPQVAAAAADKLGEVRDASAVPSLINVLDRSAWRGDPSWDEVSNSIVNALADIGDGRGLSVLNRVRLARGPVFMGRVDSAIASITTLQPARMAPAEHPTTAFFTEQSQSARMPLTAYFGQDESADEPPAYAPRRLSDEALFGAS